MPGLSRVGVRAARSFIQFVLNKSMRPRAGWRISPPVGTPGFSGSNASPSLVSKSQSNNRLVGDNPEKRNRYAVLVLSDFVGAQDVEARLSDEVLTRSGVKATEIHRCAEPVI